MFCVCLESTVHELRDSGDVLVKVCFFQRLQSLAGCEEAPKVLHTTLNCASVELGENMRTSLAQNKEEEEGGEDTPTPERTEKQIKTMGLDVEMWRRWQGSVLANEDDN